MRAYNRGTRLLSVVGLQAMLRKRVIKIEKLLALRER